MLNVVFKTPVTFVSDGCPQCMSVTHTWLTPAPLIDKYTLSKGAEISAAFKVVRHFP